MKIIHTADWHLGKQLKGASRHKEQIQVLAEICELTEKEDADVVIIAGDLYDGYAPPTESVELFYKTLKRLANNGKRAVVAIAGNHDSPERIEAPDPLAKECGIIFVGFPFSHVKPFRIESGLEITRSEPGFIELKLPTSKIPLRLILTPYANEIRLKKELASEKGKDAATSLILENKWRNLADTYCDPVGVNILVAHLLMMKEGGEPPLEELDEEKPILNIGGAATIFTNRIPKEFQYTALGHLHRRQTIDDDNGPVVYCGSPLAYSYAEKNQTKFTTVVEAYPNKKVDVRHVPLQSGKKLLTARFDDLEAAIAWLSANKESWVELTFVSDSFLKAEDKRRLLHAHPGITDIIPEMKNSDAEGNANGRKIDFNKNMEELFKDYFKSAHKGVAVSDEILLLFKECLS